MNDAFLPLPSAESARKVAEPFQVKVIPAGATGVPAFRPLAFSCAAAAPEHADATPRAEAEVMLVRDGDRITHIRLRCACGELMELRCAY